MPIIAITTRSSMSVKPRRVAANDLPFMKLTSIYYHSQPLRSHTRPSQSFCQSSSGVLLSVKVERNAADFWHEFLRGISLTDKDVNLRRKSSGRAHDKILRLRGDSH